MTHAFNPSTGEVETGSDMTGQGDEHKAEGDRSSGFSLRFRRAGIQSEDL